MYPGLTAVCYCKRSHKILLTSRLIRLLSNASITYGVVNFEFGALKSSHFSTADQLPFAIPFRANIGLTSLALKFLSLFEVRYKIITTDATDCLIGA